MRLYRREKYLKKIRGFYHDSSLIKVVTGIRRCGKSCLLETIMEELGEQGVPEKSIIYLNLDKRGYRNVKTPDQLESVIDGLCQETGMKYLFIDEIQKILSIVNWNQVIILDYQQSNLTSLSDCCVII